MTNKTNDFRSDKDLTVADIINNKAMEFCGIVVLWDGSQKGQRFPVFNLQEKQWEDLPDEYLCRKVKRIRGCLCRGYQVGIAIIME